MAMVKQTLGFSQTQMDIQFVKEMLTNSPRTDTCLESPRLEAREPPEKLLLSQE